MFRSKIVPVAAVAAVLLLLIFWFAAPTRESSGVISEGAEIAAGFSGSGSCRPCHERFYELWSTSHHGLAMQPVTEEFLSGEITPSKDPIEIGGRSYRVVVENGAGRMVESGSGEERSYPILHALGGKNIYYFLTPMERGRLQVLPLAFDLQEREWYNTTGSMVRHFADVRDEALDWRESPLTFNTSCYSCHVSQLSTNYDLETDSYGTVWAEPGINCETCHGPSSEHVRVCQEAAGGDPPKDLKIILQSSFTPQQANDTCAPCHAKMSPLTAEFLPGDDYFDHYDLHTLEHRDFYPDGRDLGENYTFTGWKLNPCLSGGEFDCVDCHTSSGRYRFAGAKTDQACTPCHAEYVNDPASHSFHKEDSEGSRCVSCHMPKTDFARMILHDHSMLPPVPAATIAFGSPNACNLCHTDQDAAWSNEWVRRWYPRDYQKPLLYRASLVDEARKGDWTRLGEMIEYIGREDRNEVFAASLIRLMDSCEDERKIPALLEALEDPSPLVRSAAADGLGLVGDERARSALLKAVGDERLVVRLRAASALSRYPREMFSGPEWEKVSPALGEYESSLQVRKDDWASHYNLGNYLYHRGRHRLAIHSFETAIKLQPRSVPPLVNASLIHAALGERQEAEAKLRKALSLEPENAAANFNLGLLVGEDGKLEEAEQHLRTALKADPAMHEAAFNLCVVLAGGRPRESLRWCRRAVELRPEEPRYLYTLAFYLSQEKSWEEAAAFLLKLLEIDASYAPAYALLGAVYEEQGRSIEAQRVYRAAAENRRLSPGDRRRYQALLK